MLPLNPDERRNVALLFLFGFGTAAAYVVARTVADSQFLSRVGPEQLPRMYLVAAGVVAVVSAIYGRFASRSTVKLSVAITLLVLAIISAMMPEIIHRYPHSKLAMASVYILAQIRGTLGTIQFTMLLNDKFARRRPERVVGYVGIGSTLAGFLGGVSLSHVINTLDVATFMYVVAVIDLLTLIPIALISRSTSRGAVLFDESFFWADSTAPGEESLDSSGRSSRKVFYLAAMVAVCVCASTFVEYQWKVTAADAFERDELALAKYFGNFYGYIYLVTGALQFFVTGQVLRKRGLLTGLLVFPLSILVASTAILVASTGRAVLWAVTMAKGADAFKRSLNDPSIHILYGRMSKSNRHRAVTVIAGMIKPITEAIAALSLVLLVPEISSRSLSGIVVVLAFIWVVLSVRVWRGFDADKQ